MTLAIFILLFLGLLIAVLNFLPTASVVTPAFLTSIATMVGYMKGWNTLFPISELFICVGIIVAYELIIFGWRALNWVMKYIRGGTS